MKAIIIARVSTEEQKEAGLSLPAQVQRLEKYCQNKGFTIIKNFSFDESAYKMQRDSFDAIIDFILAQTEKVAVCCDKVDRLSRNIFDKRISTLYEKALVDGVELHFVSDGQIINSRISASEKFQFSISLGLAKYYSDAISDNVKRAQEQKLRNGEWIAKAPYGYKNIKLPGDKTDIVVDEYASKIAQKAFELYATGAYSLALLCNKIKDDYGVVWTASHLDKIFNNHFYYGIMVIKGKQYPHKYPPLIAQALFEKVQEIKTSFNKKPAKYAGKPYIYRGLLRCDRCDLAITPEKHKGHVYYHCTQYRGKHDAKWLREEEITRQLGEVFKRMQLPADILKELVEALNTMQHDTVEFQQQQRAELKKEQRTLSNMLENLYLDKLKGSITESEYDKFYKSLKEKATDIAIRLDQLQEADDNYYITTKYLLDLSTRAYDLFISSEVEEKRQLIKLILSNVVITDEKLDYTLQTPFDLIIKCSDDQLWRP